MITHNDITMYGFIIAAQFDQLYPDGATVEQMEQDAEEHGWIRGILPNLQVRKDAEELPTLTNWSEVRL